MLGRPHVHPCTETGRIGRDGWWPYSWYAGAHWYEVPSKLICSFDLTTRWNEMKHNGSISNSRIGFRKRNVRSWVEYFYACVGNQCSSTVSGWPLDLSRRYPRWWWKWSRGCSAFSNRTGCWALSGTVRDRWEDHGGTAGWWTHGADYQAATEIDLLDRSLMYNFQCGSVISVTPIQSSKFLDRYKLLVAPIQPLRWHKSFEKTFHNQLERYTAILDSVGLITISSLLILASRILLTQINSSV